MKKYLVALVVGAGLMANGSAFAEGLNFEFERGEPIEECLRSAAKDTLLSSYQKVEFDTITDFKTYLRKTTWGGSLDNWRVYRISTFQAESGESVRVFCDSWAYVVRVKIPEG